MELKREDQKSAALLGVAHFLVDFACTGLLTLNSAGLPYSRIIACALIYNGMAFAIQLPVGALADRFSLHRGLAGAGCLMVALGTWIPQPLILCLVIGLGNACFHVGGGRESLKRGRGLAAQAGKFVAPGAIGIFLGPRLSGLFWLMKIAAPLALMALAAVLIRTRGAGRKAEMLTAHGRTVSKGRLTLVVGCMFLTVLLRSYMGTVLSYGFGILEAFCFTLCIFGGKYLGGILGDYFGTLGFSAVAQLGASLLLAVSVFIPGLAYPGILLFNTSMAITAAELHRSLPRYPGTMFGLTTFALYLGVVPKLLGMQNPWFTWWGLGLLGLLSSALLLGGLILGKGDLACDRIDRMVPSEISGTDAGS